MQGKFENTKGVIRSRKLKDKEHNCQKKKGKSKNSDEQSITQKTEDRAIRTPLKTENELGCSGRINSSCSTCDTRRVTLVANAVRSHD